MRRTENLSVSGGRTTLTIDTVAGTVEVRAATADTVRVTLDTDHPDEWEVSQLGDVVSVRAPRRRLRSRSAKLYVEAPPGSHVEVNGASADVSLVGELGDSRIRSASGDIRADVLLSLDANTASGDIRADVVHGRLAASTASGDVRIGEVGGDADASTASGDVRIDRFLGPAIQVKAVSGDITLGLPSGIRVEPDIGTLSGKTTLPSPARNAAAPTRTVRVRLRTVSGDIAISRI